MKIKWQYIVIQIIIGILLLFLWIKYIDLNSTFKYIKEINLSLILIFTIMYLSAYFIRSYRWKLILNPIKKVPFRKILPIYTIGLFTTYLVPLRIGELAKSILLKNENNMPIAKTLPTVFIDKFFDLLGFVLAVLLLSSIIFPSNEILSKVIWLSLILFIIILIFVILIVLKKEKTIILLEKTTLYLVPKKYKNNIDRILKNLTDGIFVINRPISELTLLFSLTILAIIFDGLFVCTLFYSMNYPIPFLTGVLGYDLIGLGFIVPVSPAAIGSNEVLWSLVFTTLLGLEKNKIAAITLFGHAYTTLLWILLVIIAIYTIKTFSLSRIFGK